ncbi:MAG: tRNA pseudouridine(55) synthase TruB [Chloroflexi bacterium]|nr:tRNA pseudouridine(55) synthase TruB [Chloroflexota bacterium]
MSFPPSAPEIRQPCPACARFGKPAGDLSLLASIAINSPIGILNLDKPRGLTSHDVVDLVRKATGVKRVGHSGALDPLATGVLLVLLGAATRVAEFLLASPKVYRASVYLGRATDTDDAEGRVIAEGDISGIDQKRIETSLNEFRGHILQKPPVYSALKREGQPLYRLARRGVEVETAPREVEIYRLEIRNWQPPIVDLEVECSSGTYIRALARDIGEKLGCSGHLASLVRTRIGRFPLEEAASLAEIEEAFIHGTWRDLVHPLDEALLDFAPLVLDTQAEMRISLGQAVSGDGLFPRQADMVRAYSAAGRFLALLRRGNDGRWLPHKVFA